MRWFLKILLQFYRPICFRYYCSNRNQDKSISQKISWKKHREAFSPFRREVYFTQYKVKFCARVCRICKKKKKIVITRTVREARTTRRWCSQKLVYGIRCSATKEKADGRKKMTERLTTARPYSRGEQSLVDEPCRATRDRIAAHT